MDIIKLGLIGCGGMMYNHACNVNRVEGIEITVVCDIIPERAERVAKELGTNPKVVTDFKTMVDDVDAVLVALPHDLHYECGLFFARHKKHIMMEKPLCNTEEECTHLIEVCEEEGVTLMCGYPVPFWRATVELKRLLDTGLFGRIMQMSIWTEQLTKLPEGDWGTTARLGGGQFFSHGCHYVDLLLRFLGEPLEGSHFGTRVGTEWLRREGTSVAIFKFANGAIGYHGATWGARGTRLGYNIQVQTEKGLLEYDRGANVIRLYGGNVLHVPGAEGTEGSYTRILWDGNGPANKETHYEISHFIECIHTGKEPITSGRAALQSLRIIWKMYDAEKNGTTADLRGLGLPAIE